ncbi:MAG: DsbC family protein [Panacagrimonas sp.]
MRLALALALAALCTPATASETDKDLEKLRQTLAERLPEIPKQNIQPSPAPGLYEVRRGHHYGYVSDDGNFLIIGDLVDLRSGERISQVRRRKMRLEAMQKLSDTAIGFAPEDGQVKHVVYVIVDIDCHYCRRLHQEIPEMNERGIELRYIAYPRSGPGSESFIKAQQAWCSDDPGKAIDQLMRKGKIKADAQSCDDPVQTHWEVAGDAGLNETPLIIYPDGSLFRGYIQAEGLFARLQALKAPM